MSVDDIKEEVKYLVTRLASLEILLQEIQQNCQHDFKGNDYVEICIKCEKVKSLYY